MRTHSLKIQICFLLIILSNTLKANDNIDRIKGQIKDAESMQNLEYVTVALYHQIDSSLVTGTISDANSNFTLANIPSGDYLLKFTSLGYQEITKNNISITNTTKNVNIGELYLSATTETIDEVVVNTEKKAVEYHIDKILQFFCKKHLVSI